MMRPVLTSLLSLFPVPAYAFAGAATSLHSPSQGLRNPLDVFSMAGRNPLFDTRAHDRIGTSLFAIDSDDTVLAPSRATESGNVDPVGPSIPPTDIVTAYVVYTALISIPMRHNVILNDQALVNLVGTRGWMKEVPDVQREAMKTVSARLESLEAEFDRVNQLIRENGSLLKRLEAFAGSLLRRRRTAMSTGFFRDLKARRRKLKNDGDQTRIAREWLDYTAWSNCGYVFLTDKGCKVMAALDGAKGDPKMKEMSVDDFLKLIKARI